MLVNCPVSEICFKIYLRAGISVVITIFPDSKFCRDTQATVHRTLSPSIADGRQLRLKWQICVLGTSLWQSAVVIVVIVAQRFEPSAVALFLMHSICVLSVAVYCCFAVALRTGVLTPCPSGAGVCCLCVVSGFPGFFAGRGFDPAGGAPGGG
ncbi:hypothetical protein F511_33196 [Dorcoceras hygrometricum]|uniref:Uncharacterized protein n=1 Tax=Dorcoceras hygrometricum TaxID=472368 RepID=A0A2Z7CT99_9LAMI|nr:hypothetical protein F511_33196 [Dorcoceras hygrometricum]